MNKKFKSFEKRSRNQKYFFFMIFCSIISFSIGVGHIEMGMILCIINYIIFSLQQVKFKRYQLLLSRQNISYHNRLPKMSSDQQNHHHVDGSSDEEGHDKAHQQSVLSNEGKNLHNHKSENQPHDKVHEQEEEQSPVVNIENQPSQAESNAPPQPQTHSQHANEENSNIPAEQQPPSSIQKTQENPLQNTNENIQNHNNQEIQSYHQTQEIQNTTSSQTSQNVNNINQIQSYHSQPLQSHFNAQNQLNLEDHNEENVQQPQNHHQNEPEVNENSRNHPNQQQQPSLQKQQNAPQPQIQQFAHKEIPIHDKLLIPSPEKFAQHLKNYNNEEVNQKEISQEQGGQEIRDTVEIQNEGSKQAQVKTQQSVQGQNVVREDTSEEIKLIRQSQSLEYEQNQKQISNSVVSRRILAVSVREKPEKQQPLDKNSRACNCCIM